MLAYVISVLSNWLYTYILVALLLAAGLYFTLRTRFVQLRMFGESFRVLREEKHEEGGVSSFQALMISTASRVGTGNIIGACGAILLGGPGAIFWMWIIAFFGMATIYAEAVLAQETRRVAEDGSVSGGPVYYIKRAFPGRFGTFLAGFFAVALILALGFMGCMVQSNSIGETCAAAFGVPSWAVGIAVAVLAAVVFLGFGVFGSKAALYALIAAYVTSKVSDRLTEGIKFAKAAFVITERENQVAKALMEQLKRGVTAIEARGMYSNSARGMLYCVVSRREVVRLKEIVYGEDPRAFISVTDVREVLGEGFDVYEKRVSGKKSRDSI